MEEAVVETKVEPGIPLGVKTIEKPKMYPLVEEMTFRGIIANEAEGYKLLTSIQILVNELGAATIIDLMETIQKKPALMVKAKSYLPYLKML